MGDQSESVFDVAGDIMLACNEAPDRCYLCGVEDGEHEDGALCDRLQSAFTRESVVSARRDPELPSSLPWDQLRKRSQGDGGPRSYEAQLCNSETDYGVCVITHDGSAEGKANIRFMQQACNGWERLCDELAEAKALMTCDCGAEMTLRCSGHCENDE